MGSDWIDGSDFRLWGSVAEASLSKVLGHPSKAKARPAGSGKTWRWHVRFGRILMREYSYQGVDFTAWVPPSARYPAGGFIHPRESDLRDSLAQVLLARAAGQVEDPVPIPRDHRG